jgi:hypothetical protein
MTEEMLAKFFPDFPDGVPEVRAAVVLQVSGKTVVAIQLGEKMAKAIAADPDNVRVAARSADGIFLIELGRANFGAEANANGEKKRDAA